MNGKGVRFSVLPMLLLPIISLWNEEAVMQAIGFFTLAAMVFLLVEIEVASSNPCSQFSEPSRQIMCSSDDLPDYVVNKD